MFEKINKNYSLYTKLIHGNTRNYPQWYVEALKAMIFEGFRGLRD
jgi:hypothetical protein